jgi:hypothetical protein
MPVKDSSTPKRQSTQMQPTRNIVAVVKSPERDQSDNEDKEGDWKSQVNTPGKKYVNKGISNARPVDLDNSILQPLNSSVMQDRSPVLNQNNNPSRRYVNQDLVKQTRTSPGRNVKEVQQGRNPLSPKNSSQLKENIVYSNVHTVNNLNQAQVPRIQQSTAGNNMPWSSIPQKEITLQNA